MCLTLLAMVGCEPPSIRHIHHVPPGAQPLPPLAEPVPLQIGVAGTVFDDPYSWLARGQVEARTWKDHQLEFSRAALDGIPVPPNTRDKYLRLGAAPFRITELRATAESVFYVLPDGVGGPTAPAHLMIASGGGAPGEVFAVEQPVAVRPSPDGKMFALGRAGAAPTRTVVVFDREKLGRLETLQHATAGSVTWSRDSKSFFYVGYPGGDLPSVLRHVLGEGADKDRPVFGAAAFGRNQIAKGDELSVSLGNKAITVALRSHNPARTTTTVFTTSVAAAESSDPAWRDVTPPPGLDAPVSHGDSLFLLPAASAKSQGMKRVDLNQAAPAEAFGPPGARVVAIAEAEDGLYVIRDGKVSRLTLPNGAQEDALDVPGDLRAVALEASPFVPGARAFFSSCTGGGWFSFRPGDRAAHKLALDPRVAESQSLDVRALLAKSGDGVVEVTVLGRRRVGGGPRPTVLFPHPCGTFSPELGPWLENGGAAAFCGLHPLRDATTPLAIVEGRRRQAAELRACAHALVAEKIATPATIGIRASGEAGLVVLSALVDEPQLVKAVAIGQGIFDARRPGAEGLPEARVRDTNDLQAMAASVPYLQVRHALPPFLLVLSPHPDDVPANWQSLKLAARLESLRTEGLAALVIQPKDPDDGHHGPGGTAAVSADVDAFMRVELDPTAASGAPLVMRADAVYAAQHANRDSPATPAP